VDSLANLTALEGVASAMAGTRDGIDVMLRDRGLRRTTPDLTGHSLLLGAHASAALAGSTTTFERLEAGEYDDAAAAAVRVSTELLGLSSTLAKAPLQVLARLHALAAKGTMPDDELGRPVQGADRLADLARLLTGPTSAPALVVAAVAHAEVQAVAPFASHNGIVARALERLLIVARGVDPTSLVVPEAGHLAFRAEYQSNLRAYRDGGLAGVHAWLLYAATAFTAGAESSPLRTA
jgi:hypothetical protein